jgi:hypothetical protein
MRKFLIGIELLIVGVELALLAARRHWALLPLLMALVLAGLVFLSLAR